MKGDNKIKAQMRRIILICFFVLAILVAGCEKETSLPDLPDNQIAVDNTELETIYTGSTNQGDVEISLKPISVKDGIVELEITANTHSVEMNQFDLKSIAVLEHDGRIIAPVEAPVLNGHHTSGKIVFNAGEDADTFIIKIKGIPNVEERVFEWG